MAGPILRRSNFWYFFFACDQKLLVYFTIKGSKRVPLKSIFGHSIFLKFFCADQNFLCRSKFFVLTKFFCAVQFFFVPTTIFCVDQNFLCRPKFFCAVQFFFVPTNIFCVYQIFFWADLDKMFDSQKRKKKWNSGKVFLVLFLW